MSITIEKINQNTASDLNREVLRRRTFAIISHPDAGKTTLTEKFLLYAGATHMAGAVRARSNVGSTASDWMDVEKQRGISVSATALEMEYQGYRINLLDTPGHQDFSEDTYRTLMAVDSAVMVLDSAKGIEPQTEKLFRVCRMRGIPILTFINKMDRPGRDPLSLIDEIENTLGIDAVPVNWPIGEAPSFKGVYDLKDKQVLLFKRTEHGKYRAPVEITGMDDPSLPKLVGETSWHKIAEDVELLSEVGKNFDTEQFLAGEMTPVFFGSALNNFGVEPFLNALLEMAPPPSIKETDQGNINPADETFSGFIFKVQANLDPRHRDRMAFMRVCSGRFFKDMNVYHPRLKRNVKLSRAFRLFAREREPVEEAFPGDIIGIISPGLFTIGDTITNGDIPPFARIPRFPPEHFAKIINSDISRYKQFNRGLKQLEEEGAVQVFVAEDNHRREPILAAVGELQFDVVLARLQEEYGVQARINHLPFSRARWVQAKQEDLGKTSLSLHTNLRCLDKEGRLVILFSSDWDLEYCQRENPNVTFVEMG